MLDINLIRKTPEIVRKTLQDRNIKTTLVDDFLALDDQWRKLVQEIDNNRAELNKFSKERNIEEAKKVKEKIKTSEAAIKDIEKRREDLIYAFPNIPAVSVPVGKDESENKVIRTWGSAPKFSFEPKDHVAIGENLDIIDIERAGKVIGTRFAYLKGAAALLEFALIQHTFSILTSPKIIKKIAGAIGVSPKPFIPVVPPVMIRPDVFRRLGRLNPEDKDERYYLQQDDVYLVGSAEHTLGPLHMDETLIEADLPIRYVGFSTSFRREAGASGKDTRGILRVHQFDKIELESFSSPEASLKEQDFFVAIQEYLLQTLELPYQVVQICTGDMGRPDARQIDIECWVPSQKRYRETHTSDLMTDYQTRRLNTRIRRKNGKIELAHTNDATAFAIGRILIAILENYQQKDGSVKIPEVLQKYLGGLKSIKR